MENEFNKVLILIAERYSEEVTVTFFKKETVLEDLLTIDGFSKLWLEDKAQISLLKKIWELKFDAVNAEEYEVEATLSAWEIRGLIWKAAKIDDEYNFLDFPVSRCFDDTMVYLQFKEDDKSQ